MRTAWTVAASTQASRNAPCTLGARGGVSDTGRRWRGVGAPVRLACSLACQEARRRTQARRVLRPVRRAAPLQRARRVAGQRERRRGCGVCKRDKVQVGKRTLAPLHPQLQRINAPPRRIHHQRRGEGAAPEEAPGRLRGSPVQPPQPLVLSQPRLRRRVRAPRAALVRRQPQQVSRQPAGVRQVAQQREGDA